MSTSPPYAPPTAMSLGVKPLVDALAVLIPVGVSAAQFLKGDKSYEVIFLAACVALLYFLFRGNSIRMTALETELHAERDHHERTRDECEQRDVKWQTDMNALREHNASELDKLDQRRRAELGTLETSLVNAFSDLTAMADRRRVGHFERDPNNHMLVYVRAPVVLPPDVPADRRLGQAGQTTIAG